MACGRSAYARATHELDQPHASTQGVSS
jgi:hypothetical protein